MNNTPGVVNGGSGNLPPKFAVLTNNSQPRARLRGQSGLVSRVELRWRAQGHQRPSGRARPVWRRHDATANVFQINLKTTSLGMKKGTVYVVEVRVLASGSDPKPGGYDAVGGRVRSSAGRPLLVKAEK